MNVVSLEIGKAVLNFGNITAGMIFLKDYWEKHDSASLMFCALILLLSYNLAVFILKLSEEQNDE